MSERNLAVPRYVILETLAQKAIEVILKLGPQPSSFDPTTLNELVLFFDALSQIEDRPYGHAERVQALQSALSIYNLEMPHLVE